MFLLKDGSHLVRKGVEKMWPLPTLGAPPDALLQHHVALPAQVPRHVLLALPQVIQHSTKYFTVYQVMQIRYKYVCFLLFS
jgi:hypothetical protein